MDDQTGPSSRDDSPRKSTKKSSQTSHKLSEKKLKRLKEQHEARGIIYISRIPPHMKPQKLRQMLEQHAEIGRIYLALEDPSIRKKRKEHGGNSGKNFTEGWVEFEDKAEAKRVAAALNGQPMGGRRRSAYYYDLWCMKYLPKFKWDHLTEEINYQKAVREQRLAAEVSAAKRERDFYLSRVDKAKAVAAITERKRKRTEEGKADEEAPVKGRTGNAPKVKGARNPQGSTGDDGDLKVQRTYGQRKAKADSMTDASAPMLSKGLLKLIAGKNG